MYLQIVHDKIFVTSSVHLTETEVGLHHPHRKAWKGTVCLGSFRPLGQQNEQPFLSLCLFCVDCRPSLQTFLTKARCLCFLSTHFGICWHQKMYHLPPGNSCSCIHGEEWELACAAAVCIYPVCIVFSDTPAISSTL